MPKHARRRCSRLILAALAYVTVLQSPSGSAQESLDDCESGLHAEYYGDMQLARLALTRRDPQVDFDWGDGSPDPALGASEFSVRWTGSVQPRFSEEYTFYTLSDDGVRLWVNDQLLVDNWTLHAETENSGRIWLEAGRLYGLRMEFFEYRSRALARLLWSSASQPREVIPASELRARFTGAWGSPGPPPPPPPPSEGRSYYVDFESGNDASDGRSPTSAWRHAPGDAAAAGVAAAHKLMPGDRVVFKRGVAYRGTITVGSSGAVVYQGSTARIGADGTLTDTNARFLTRGVSRSHWVNVHHSKTSQDDTWVESTGLFRVEQVLSETQLRLAGFRGAGHDTPEVTYAITDPITYTSIASWGSGDAVLDGEGTRPILFELAGHDVLRFEGLKFVNTQYRADLRSAAIHSRDGGADHLQVLGCVFQDLGVHGIAVNGLPDQADYGVISGNEFRNFGYQAVASSMPSVLIERNQVLGPGIRGFMGGRFAVLRYNLVRDMTGGTRVVGPHAPSHSPFCWYDDASGTCQRDTLAQWQARGYDVSGLADLRSDPRFLDMPALDLRLGLTSPDIDRGTDLSRSFRVDLAGNARPQGSAYDMGAHELKP